jgi:hypothetical protein
MFSLRGTREDVATLSRASGLTDLPVAVRRLGEVAREGALLGALGAAVLGLAWRRERVRLPLAAVALAAAALAGTALAGGPINTRYVLGLGVLACLLAGFALTGWRRERAHRDAWRWLAAGTLGVLLALALPQASRLEHLHGALNRSARAEGDLRALVADHPLRRCARIGVPNSRPVPFLALVLDRDPASIVPRGRGALPPERTAQLWFATAEAARAYELDPRDPGADRRRTAPTAVSATNASWLLSARC